MLSIIYYRLYTNFLYYFLTFCVLLYPFIYITLLLHYYYIYIICLVSKKTPNKLCIYKYVYEDTIYNILIYYIIYIYIIRIYYSYNLQLNKNSFYVNCSINNIYNIRINYIKQFIIPIVLLM